MCPRAHVSSHQPFLPPVPDFLGEDGSSFSSLIMPNSTPICHVYSAGTKQRGELRLCPLPLAPYLSPNHDPSSSHPAPARMHMKQMEGSVLCREVFFQFQTLQALLSLFAFQIYNLEIRHDTFNVTMVFYAILALFHGKTGL